jgi:hypothetical protein
VWRYGASVPLQNRVTPLGSLVADPARGLVYGNRGCLHDDLGRIRRHYAVRRWIACRLEFRGRRRGRLLQPGRYTELFFLDEATAFAAGHRPCAECRREDYVRFAELWRELHPGDAGAEAVDTRLHGERLTSDRGQRHHEARATSLPDGAFVLHEDAPWVVVERALRRWTPAGYVESGRLPSGSICVVTPVTLVEILRSGWESPVPLLHPSAG